MPSTVIFKSGYPSTSTPISNSASVADDGFVSVDAQFLISSSQKGTLQVNAPLPASLFSSLDGQSLQKDTVFIASSSTEKRDGLCIVSVNCVGAINPPVVKYSEEVSPRSFNKSKSNDIFNQFGFDIPVSVFSFDYSASTTSATCAFVDGSQFQFSPKTPEIFAIWNRVGGGVILRYDASGNPILVEYPETANEGLVATPVLITTKNSEVTAGIKRMTITKQVVYQ